MVLEKGLMFLGDRTHLTAAVHSPQPNGVGGRDGSVGHGAGCGEDDLFLSNDAFNERRRAAAGHVAQA